MRSLFLALALSVSAPAFADDGGVTVIPGQVEVGVVVLAPAPAPAPIMMADGGTVSADDLAKALDNPLGSFKSFYTACKEGQWWAAAMFLLFVLVGFFRVLGKKLHAWIPDDTKQPVLLVIEKCLMFIYDTKVGGWLLNWVTAIAGCLAMAHLAGMQVDAHAWQTALLASTGSTALIELKDDVMEWWDKRKKAQEEAAAAEAAKKAAVVTPVAPVAPAEPPKT